MITINKSTKVKETAKANGGWNFRSWLPYLALFALVVVAGLLNDFAFKHVLTTFEYDGWFYRWTSNRLTEFLMSLAHGQPNFGLVTDHEFQMRILPDGPAMPLFFGTIAFLLGHSPYSQDWQFVVAVQCVMQAVSACLVMLLCQRVCGNKTFAFVGGLLWGLYPPAIIATRIFMTEQLTALLLLAYAVFATDKNSRVISWIAAGLTAGLTSVQKVAMIPGILMSAFWSFKTSQHKIRSAFLFFASIAIVVSSWAFYTHQTMGRTYLTAQRYSDYNAVIGWDTEADGLNGSNTPLLPLLMTDELGAGIVAQWMIHTKECTLLLAKKITRLFAVPYNDYFDHCWSLPASTINDWHVALLYLSVMGAFCFLLDSKIRLTTVEGNAAVRTGDVCLLLLGGHLVYLLFVASGRYALTSVPFWVVFATYFLWRVAESIKERNKLALGKLIVSIILGILISTFMVQAQAIATLTSSRETAHKLLVGTTAVKEITFSPAKSPANAKAALIFVDADKNIVDAKVELNGHTVEFGLKPLGFINQDIYWAATPNATLAHALGIETDQFRQWRACIVPINWLNLDGKNVIKLTQQNKPSVLYGDGDPNCRIMPDPIFTAGGNMTANNIDMRMVRTIKAANIKQVSFLLEPNGQQTALADSLRVKIAALPAKALKTISTNDFQPTEQTPIKVSIPNKRFDTVLWWKAPEYLQMSKLVVKTAKNTGVNIDIPHMPPNANSMAIKLTGEVMATKDNAEPSAAVYIYKDVDISQNYLSEAKTKGKGKAKPVNKHIALGAILNGTPDHLVVGRQWQKFEINGYAPLSGLGKNQVYVALYHGPWLDVTNYGAEGGSATAAFRNLNIEFAPLNLCNLDLNKLIYY